jgi:hypothetical protein
MLIGHGQPVIRHKTRLAADTAGQFQQRATG